MDLLEEMRAALGALYTDDFARVVRFVMYNGAALHDAQDAANEAFAEASKSIADGSWHRVGNPGGWIRRVALRRWRRPPRSRNSVLAYPVAELPEPVTDVPPHEVADSTLDVLAALARLAPTPRAVIAFAMDGYSVAETAEALRIGYGEVTDLRAKAKKSLRKYLADEGRA
ncbi:RNA polymerase sigma factor [Actinomadura nitritigenes]|uniref:RNA polymerase sigma factor n=1 Tax=Actinomadura nitritigenes TaxID=134602 RepID=UPI003D8D7A33